MRVFSPWYCCSDQNLGQLKILENFQSMKKGVVVVTVILELLLAVGTNKSDCLVDGTRVAPSTVGLE